MPVNIHASWFIIFFFFAFVFEGHFDREYSSWSGLEQWLAALSTSFLVFMSVLAHELSHSLVAILRGIPVKGITLFIFGGVSQLSREAQKPSTEFIVAVVGPFSSILLGLLFLALAVGLEGLSSHLSAIALVLFSVNLALAVFNMLPGFPMDGGRVLRAAVWRVTRNYWLATRLASRVGQVMAIAMIIAGVVVIILDTDNLMPGLLWIFIGMFLHGIASASYRQMRLRENLHRYKATDLLNPQWLVAGEDTSLSQIQDSYFVPGAPDLLVVARDGVAQGIITPHIVKKVPGDKRHRTRAGSAMVPLEKLAAVGPQEGAYEVLELMDTRGADHVVVFDGGVLIGFIGRQSLLSAMKLHVASGV